jgi:hypothetical protein
MRSTASCVRAQLEAEPHATVLRPAPLSPGAVQRLLEKAGAAVDRRNELMHTSVWGQLELPDGTWVSAIFKASRKSGRFRATKMTVEDVESIAAGLLEASDELAEFMRSHFGRPVNGS